MRHLVRFFLTAVTLATMSAAPPTDITKESGDLAVRVIDPLGEMGWPRVEIRRLAGGAPVTMELERTRVVKDALFTGPNRLTIHGELSSRGDIITIIDTQSNKIIDKLWGYKAAFSPDLKTVAYEFRTPPQPGQTRFSAALMAYDLTAPPAANTMPGMSNEPEERGIALYPENLRLAQRPWILLDESEPDRTFVSPIAWSPDSRKVAVIDHYPDADVLVIADISKGLRQPLFRLIPVPRQAFLLPQYKGTIPEEYATAAVSCQELEFTADGQYVQMKSFHIDPYAEKTIIMPVSAPSE